MSIAGGIFVGWLLFSPLSLCSCDTKATAAWISGPSSSRSSSSHSPFVFPQTPGRTATERLDNSNNKDAAFLAHSTSFFAKKHVSEDETQTGIAFSQQGFHRGPPQALGQGQRQAEGLQQQQQNTSPDDRLSNSNIYNNKPSASLSSPSSSYPSASSSCPSSSIETEKSAGATNFSFMPFPSGRQKLVNWKNRRLDQDQQTLKVNLQIGELAAECTRSSRNVTAAVQAIQLLRTLGNKADTVSYNSVLKALAAISPARIAVAGGSHAMEADAALVAHELWHEMVGLHQVQVQANEDWYSRLHQLSEEEIAQGAPRIRVKPNFRTYSTVMNAWSRHGDYQKCEFLLEQLWQNYHATNGDLALRPNLITYNTLLNAYAKCGGEHAEQRCLQTIQQMLSNSSISFPSFSSGNFSICINIQPDVISHNAVLHCLAKSGRDTAGQRAETYLRRVFSQNKVLPNSRSYTTCMDAWSQVGRPDRAHALLDEMLQQYYLTKREELRPNVVTFTTLIHAYARSNSSQKAIKAQELYQQMQSPPCNLNADDTYIINSLLNACASIPAGTRPSPSTIQMLHRTYQHALEQGLADDVTFGTVLKAAALRPDIFSSTAVDRPADACEEEEVAATTAAWKFAVSVFEQACQAGQVSDVVWNQFRAVGVPSRALAAEPAADDPPTLFRIPDFKASYQQAIPPEWRQNVVSRFATAAAKSPFLSLQRRTNRISAMKHQA